MRKLIFALTVSVFLIGFTPGDAIKTDFYNINKKSLEANSCRVKARVLFDYAGVDQHMFMSSKRLGTLYSFTYDKNHFLYNDAYTILVNDEEKIIFVQDAEGEKDDEKEIDMRAVDSLLVKGYNYSLVKDKGDLREVKTILKEPNPYTEIKITYDRKMNSFKKIEYTCGKDLKSTGLGKVTVQYDEFNYTPGLSKSDFDESVYIETKGKKILGPAARFSAYKVIDQRLDR